MSEKSPNDYHMFMLIPKMFNHICDHANQFKEHCM